MYSKTICTLVFWNKLDWEKGRKLILSQWDFSFKQLKCLEEES